MLEDYYFVIKEHARYNYSTVPQAIRFTGRKICEFKQEIFNRQFTGKADLNITDKDLEVLHSNCVLDNDDDLEYCLTTRENPLIIYVPTELTSTEYKQYTSQAMNNLENYPMQYNMDTQLNSL